MRYAIGLDVGISSVGWSVLELAEEDRPIRIVDLGARIFERAEQPKTGESLAAPRREARGQRRRIRRKKHRKERIYGLIVSSGILTKEKVATLYEGDLTDIYELRAKALDFPVSAQDFARIMIHLSQRRGFKSNRKSVDENDKENSKLLAAIKDNSQKLEKNGYRTVGEMLFLDSEYIGQKRNKGEDYKNTITRELVEIEVNKIFSAQRSFGMMFADEKIEKSYLDILLSQRSFAQGPGSGPYSGNQIEKMIGKCTLEEGESRCSKATYSFQLFNLLQRINHLRISSPTGVRGLSAEQRKALVEYAHEHEAFNYHHVRKILGDTILADETFVGVRYDKETKKSEESKKINDLAVYHKIRKTLNAFSKDTFSTLSVEMLDEIGEAFSKNLSDDEIVERLENKGLEKQVVTQLLSLPNYSKYGHISLVACRKLLPHLEQGYTYDKACAAAGYDFKGIKGVLSKYLPPIDANDTEITNPVVKRAISQSIKVINAIIRKMGEKSPVYLNIELARELTKKLDERRKIEKQYAENAKENERLVEQIKEYGVAKPSGQDIIKLKLWNEQSGVCPYSQEYLPIEKLFSPGYVDIDHIVPYSRSFDDRLINKVLVKASENRQKSNRLPLEYLQGEKRDKFTVWVKNQNYKKAKKELLLKEKLADEDGWKARNLQDTQFISSYLHRYITENLEFAEGSTKKRRVYTVNGAVTAYVRKRWGVNKIRANGDLHHAVDATVVACISQGMIKDIQNHSFYKETYESGAYRVDESTGEVIDKFPRPWSNFLNELDIRLECDGRIMRKMLFDANYQTYSEIDLDDVMPPFVSRMSNHKVTGAAHQATIRSKLSSNGEKTVVVSKVDLKKLKLGKDGEIENYYNPSSDTLLYNALKKRLAENDNNGEKAFEEPFYKPKSDGSNGPQVKKVKICEMSSLCVDVQESTAVAANETMVRCDVFYVENDGYYFVPIYVADTVKPDLPCKACVAGKKPWKQMKESDFVFSLYPNDVFKYYSKKTISLSNRLKESTLAQKLEISGDDGVFMYFKGLDIAVALLNAITHDGVYEIRSIGKTSVKLEKYEVDVLGKYRMVKKETRRGFKKIK